MARIQKPSGKTPTEEDPWAYVDFMLKKNRLDLINEFNRVVGPPSYQIQIVQNDFIQDRMDPAETIAFVKVCRGLIAAGFAVDRLPR